MDDPPLASLSLTHVHYNPNDPISHASAFLALAPQALVIAYITTILVTREAEVLLMFGGQLSCEALNWALKRCIKQQRPATMHGKGYGMPSSHAQFVAYFSVSLAMFLLLRHSPRAPDTGSSTHVPTSLGARLALSVLALVCAAAVAASRVYLSYHTAWQVCVGGAAGVLYAVAWYGLTGAARHFALVDWVLDTPLARWARLRDLVVNEDIADAGWERWEVRRRQKRGASGRVEGHGDTRMLREKSR